jgi:hemolysin-activating ACP:hemolysin acyltransferase
MVTLAAPFGHVEQIVPMLTANPRETRVRTLWHNRTGERYRILEWSRPLGESVVQVRSYGVAQFARILTGA